MGRVLPLALASVLFAGACGVKASPRPPGIQPARRGEPPRDCPGCEIPAPDSYPTPSTPFRTEDLPREAQPETQPVLPGEEGGAVEEEEVDEDEPRKKRLGVP